MILDTFHVPERELQPRGSRRNSLDSCRSTVRVAHGRPSPRHGERPIVRRRLLAGLSAFLLAPAAFAAAGSDSALGRELAVAAPAANPKVLQLAARAAECARSQGLLDGFRHLAVIDYSLPSTQPRLWVFDLERGRLLFQELVAHGRNTGEGHAERFSNVEGSKMSSLGLFQATETYYGSNGYSLRLRGLDPGFNDNALTRAIVMHGAPYVSAAIAERLGRLGRSWGCPAVRQDVARVMIDTLKGGSLLFAYYPDRKWLQESPFFKCEAKQDNRQIVSRDPRPGDSTG